MDNHPGTLFEGGPLSIDIPKHIKFRLGPYRCEVQELVRYRDPTYASIGKRYRYRILPSRYGVGAKPKLPEFGDGLLRQ
jgi:hypothetical protein